MVSSTSPFFLQHYLRKWEDLSKWWHSGQTGSHGHFWSNAHLTGDGNKVSHGQQQDDRTSHCWLEDSFARLSHTSSWHCSSTLKTMRNNTNIKMHSPQRCGTIDLGVGYLNAALSSHNRFSLELPAVFLWVRFRMKVQLY